MPSVRVKPCIPTPQRADRRIVRGEGYAAFLTRSTLPTANHIRRFVNTNVAKLPPDAAAAICRGINSARFHEACFELIVGRTLQELGIDDLAYEPLQSTGKRPDFLAMYSDGAVFVDARHPEWLAELARANAANERLIDVIEEVIPQGWRYLVHRLPRIGPNDPVRGFRESVRAALAALPQPRKGSTHRVSSGDSRMGFDLELRAGRVRHRAWLMGPGTADFVAPDAQIADALKKKRGQLRGLPHPALVALGGALGASVDDYDIALFGRTFERFDSNGRVVERGFDSTGMFAKPRDGQPTIAGVLAFTGMDVTTGRDPILYVHPRFTGTLPAALLQLEVRTLEAHGPRSRPATMTGIFERLSAPTRRIASRSQLRPSRV